MAKPPSSMPRRLAFAGLGVVVLLLAALYGPTAAFHARPFSITGEAERLAELLEIGPGSTVAEITARAAREAVANVIVVEADETATNLPDACCDAIFMRNVYHHIGNVRPFNASVRQALKDGGRLVVIDFAPGAFWHLAGRPPGASAERTGHGVPRTALIAEVTAAGFRLEREIENWGGRMFLVLFRKRPVV
jgi:SAM-dependent methyltransferase